ncbi:MAG: hypothetical protein WEA11_00405 [Acidimicrobiales bacterium]
MSTGPLPTEAGTSKDYETGLLGRAPWVDAIAVWAGVLVLLFGAVWFGARGPFAMYGGVDPTGYMGSSLFGGWFRFDGNWYNQIATSGYRYAGPDTQSSVAFFPGYPSVLWVLHSVTGLSVKLLGSIVTIACGLGAVLAIFQWFRDRVTDRIARIALVTFLLYPYVFYLFGAVYGDALFLVAAVVAFLLLERGHPVLAGLVGAVATASRPVGIALIIGLVAVSLWRRRVIESGDSRWLPRIQWRRLRLADAGVLLSLGGLIGYMTFLGIRFGHPLAFDEVQSAPGWDQGSGPRTWFKITWFQQIKNLPGWVGDWFQTGDTASFEKAQYAVTVIVQGLFVLGFLFLAWQVWKKFGWGYGLYCFSMLAFVLLGSKDFQGAGRYLLAAFPCFAVLGGYFADRTRLRWVWWSASGIVLLVWVFAFGRGYYVA